MHCTEEREERGAQDWAEVQGNLSTFCGCGVLAGIREGRLAEVGLETNQGVPQTSGLVLIEFMNLIFRGLHGRLGPFH